jgi:hypothetical protein
MIQLIFLVIFVSTRSSSSTKSRILFSINSLQKFLFENKKLNFIYPWAQGGKSCSAFASIRIHSDPFPSIPIHSDKFSVCLFPGQGLKIRPKGPRLTFNGKEGKKTTLTFSATRVVRNQLFPPCLSIYIFLCRDRKLERCLIELKKNEKTIIIIGFLN